MRVAGGLACILVVIFGGGCRKTSVSSEDDTLVNARAAAAKLPKTVAIEPYGLEARVPADWTCKREPPERSTTCSGPAGGASWSLGPPRVDSDLEERARRVEQDAKDRQGRGGTSYYGRTNLAGFEGFLYGNSGAKRPEDWVAFTGEKDVPGHGKLALTVSVGSEDWLDEVPWLAVVLTTRIGPAGLATSWPSDTEIEAKARELEIRGRADRAMAKLADDNASSSWWVASAQELARPESEDAGTKLLASRVAGGEEAVRALVVRRIDVLAAREASAPTSMLIESSNAMHALGLARTLRGWDDAAFARSLVLLEKIVVGSKEMEAASPERVLAIAYGMLVLSGEKKEEERGALLARMRTEVSSSPPETFTTRDGARILSLALSSNDAKTVTWVAEKITTARPYALEHGDLAGIFTDERVRALPGVKQRLGTLLSDKAPYGKAVFEETMLSIRWPTGSLRMSRHVDAQVPEGTSATLRICDCYARFLSPRGTGKASTGFDVLASEQERDAWIAAWKAAGP